MPAINETLLSQLLKEDFIELLSLLPDEFYHQPQDFKDCAFSLMLNAASRGERNPARLVELVPDYPVTQEA